MANRIANHILIFCNVSDGRLETFFKSHYWTGDIGQERVKIGMKFHGELTR